MVRLLAPAVLALAALAAAKSAVLDLTPSNFDSVVLKSGKPTLVEFFAPWCGHCKNLAPVYEELASAYEFTDKVQIAKVDADAERSLGQRFGVQGFPTLKWFDGVSETPTDYSSGRDLESLTSFIGDKTGVKPRKKYEPPSSIEFLTDATFGSVVGGDKGVFVAFTAPWCGHCKNLAPTWEKLAADFADDDVVIAKVDADAEHSKQTAKDHGVSSYPTIMYFAAGSTKGELYNEARSEEALVSFVNKQAGLFRKPGGGLNEEAGRVSELDNIVAQFNSGVSKLTVAAEAAKKAANTLRADVRNKMAEYYVRVFNKLEKNKDYVTKEYTRLQGILAKGGLAQAKADELTAKVNILRKFTEKEEAAMAAAAKEEAAKEEAAKEAAKEAATEEVKEEAKEETKETKDEL